VSEPNAEYVRMVWRVGSQVGRTIYAQEPGDEHGTLIGVMDTPELALDACTHHNNFVHRMRRRAQNDRYGEP
jgi:hypothetical protein